MQAYPAQQSLGVEHGAPNAAQPAGVHSSVPPDAARKQASPLQHCAVVVQREPAIPHAATVSQRPYRHMSPAQHVCAPPQAPNRGAHTEGTSVPVSTVTGTSAVASGSGTTVSMSIPLSVTTGTSMPVTSRATSSRSASAVMSARASRRSLCSPSHGIPHAPSPDANSDTNATNDALVSRERLRLIDKAFSSAFAGQNRIANPSLDGAKRARTLAGARRTMIQVTTPPTTSAAPTPSDTYAPVSRPRPVAS